jgi:protein SCO1/2
MQSGPATRYFSALMRPLVHPALLLGLTFAPACRPEPKPPEAAAASEAGLPAAVARNRIRGVIRNPPLPKPDLRMQTVDGNAFELIRDTRGYLTLLFFGYTHCPDVCPVHVANVSKVLKELPIDVSGKVRFVFITTDPERDTPEKLKSWLANFHPGFIGLTGTAEEIKQAQLSLGLLPAGRELPDSTKPQAYLVSHAAVVFAFTADDSAHVMYPFGIRQTDWANDLPILANGFPR